MICLAMKKTMMKETATKDVLVEILDVYRTQFGLNIEEALGEIVLETINMSILKCGIIRGMTC